MPITVPDLLPDTFLEEENGEVVRATRVFVQTVGDRSTKTAGQVLSEALAASGVPQPGEAFDSTYYPDLCVESRTPTVIGLKDSDVAVRIEIKYELHRSIAENLPLSGGASLTQIKTQKDRNGVPITVAYDGETIGAEVSVYVVQGNFTREVVRETTDPEAEVAAWANHVNDAEFRSGGAGEWLCTRVDYDLTDKDADPPKYRFVYEFERRPTGWTYTVAYNDENGNIPPDLIEGVGIVDVKWHPERDFSEFA